MSETVLWTNPSPSASFGAQTVSLSQNMNNYEYIGFYWSYPATNDPICTLMKVTDFKKTSNDKPSMALAAGFRTGVGTDGRRSMYYISNTSVGFRDALAATTQVNDSIVPRKIVGLK